MKGTATLLCRLRTASSLGPAAVLDPFDAAFGSSFHFGVTNIPEPPE